MSISCQPLLSSSLCVCVCIEPFIPKEVLEVPTAYGRDCFQVTYVTEGHGLVLDLVGLQLDSFSI